MFRWWHRRQALKRAKEIGMSRGMVVGVRRDGSIDFDVQEDDESGWNFNNLSLVEAEFLHTELGRAIARQKERGFPRPEPPNPASST